jgi:CheY-like chemotaxis protein
MQTVLMIDDNETDIHLLRFAAKADTAFQVDAASTADNAIRYLRTHSEPDLVVLDCSLGMESWYDVLRRLRQERNLRSPVVLLSGYVRPETERVANSLGVPCFEKPMELDGWSALAVQFLDLSRQSIPN